MSERIRRTFAGDLSELRPMSQWLRQVASETGVDDGIAWAAELCLNEVAANIILYAHDDGLIHPITIELEQTNQMLRMVVIDAGRPFNPLAAAPFPKPQSLEDAPVSGMGIQLVRSAATEISYTREEPRNVLALAFALPESASGYRS